MTSFTADQIVGRCRSTWLASGIDTKSADEMAQELRSHLQEATAAGKTLDTVVGEDTESFASEWAAEFQGPQRTAAADSTSRSAPHAVKDTTVLWLGAATIVLLVAALAVFGPKDGTVDQTLWTGVWIGAAAALAVGEMVTAGFFLLPFAVGAASAAILTLAGLGTALQLIGFAVVSLIALYVIQRFATQDSQGDLAMVGAARYVGATAIVTEPIDRRTGSGSVKMGTELWRATTNTDAVIAEGAEVSVTEVSGVRLVVEPLTTHQ